MCLKIEKPCAAKSFIEAHFRRGRKKLFNVCKYKASPTASLGENVDGRNVKITLNIRGENKLQFPLIVRFSNFTSKNASDVLLEPLDRKIVLIEVNFQ